MPQSPSNVDTDVELWKKAAINWYDFAVDFGVTGLNPVNWQDNKVDLLRKLAYYSAKSLDNHP